ncbi:MAG: VOC family protein [Xanthobacteraceae bacterium]
MSEPRAAPSFGTVYQFGYVTNDLDRALEVFRTRHGVPAFKDFGDTTLKRDEGGETRIRFALCFVGSTQLEIIEPRGGKDSLYSDVLPSSGFGLVWHHIAFKVPSLDVLEKMKSNVIAAGHSIALSGGDPSIAKFFYVDSRHSLGHYIEHLYLSPEREAFHASLPRH